VTFLAGSSFLVLLVRDPGTVLLPREEEEEEEEGERGMTLALLRDGSGSVASGKWCGEVRSMNHSFDVTRVAKSL
jgi:hypothetical protein